MSRRTTKRSSKRPSDDRPSIWFFVALALGIALLIWVFANVAMKPVTPPAATTTTHTR
jgi:hypothetical protein